MKIICNGEVRELDSGLKVVDFLTQLGLASASVVVECDGRVLDREEYASHQLRDGSVLELIRFVGGG